MKPENDKDIYHLGHNEYIIYDEEQVRIRYLVQIDTQNQEDIIMDFVIKEALKILIKPTKPEELL